MKKLVCWAVIVFCVSCTSQDKKYNSSKDAAASSVLEHYNRSLDSSLSFLEQKQAIDRAYDLGKDLDKDILFNKVLYQKCRFSLTSGQYDSLLIYDKMLQSQATRMQDDPNLARQHYLMGYYFDRIAKLPDSAFTRYNSAKNHFLQMPDSAWVGKSLLNMGTIQKDQNDFFGSKETLTEAIEYLNATEDYGYMADVLNLLATNHRKLQNFSDATAYYEKAISVSENNMNRLIYQNNLAATLIDQKVYEKAISILENIIQDTLLNQDQENYARVSDNLAYANWLSGKDGRENQFLDALKMRKEEGDKRGLIASYTHLGEFHSQKRPQVAMTYFDSVIRLSKSIKKPRAEVDALKFLMSLEPNNVQRLKRYIFLQDSLYTQELNVKTQFAKYKYDNQVTQEKSLRLEKENAEKELEVTRQRNQKIVAFFMLAFLFGGIGFLIYYFKQRTRRLTQENKTAKLEATLETEAEMSRRLHDDFGAGLNQAMLMVQSDMHKSKILDRLEGLYGQSRNFSREINEVDTGPHFKEELLGMLQFRTPENAKLYHSGTGGIDWELVNPLAKKVLFKVLQELMINMGKHSEATLISIEFENKAEMLRINYMDNGVGASELELKTKNGLRNTEKRIRAIGGTITFDSVKGEGFKANIEIPK
ncbi:tetratricopeptide repeat protein [Flagellimonas beolgyonensis]|uniref:tetratricopeptide repeat-containing sensor histidine kinase n=1 Tax=Flagellimonas beolgyonensis TaxID=864064 RepID=UPI003D6602EB